MPITKGFRTLVDEATAQITTYTVAQVQARLAAGDPALQLVDIRDPRELEREGTAPGCVHAPRGMLEFWIDPQSHYHKPLFAEDKRFVFFCAGGLRSALNIYYAENEGTYPQGAWSTNSSVLTDSLVPRHIKEIPPVDYGHNHAKTANVFCHFINLAQSKVSAALAQFEGME